MIMREIKTQIEELEKKKAIIQVKINKLTDIEEKEVVLPKCKALVGVCLKSEYGDNRYAQLLEILENTDLGIYFLMEEFYTTKEGSVYFVTNNCYPYTNKEWWDADIPISGWTRVSKAEYQKHKAKAWQEFNSRNVLRKYTIKPR